MGYNLPEGNNSFLNDDDMICQHCDHKDDVSNGEYHDHMWYCDDCFKELFKVCPKCNVCVISADEEMCEDCLANKTYEESAQGMFDKEGYSLRKNNNVEVVFSESLETLICNHIVFDLESKTYDVFMNQFTSVDVSIGLHKAIHQKLIELKWL